MEFLGAIEERTCENSIGHLKKIGISRGVLEKLMWSFLGPLFLTLDFPRGVTQSCRISRGRESLSFGI